MAEDRFANVFSAGITMSAANTVTFAELNFGIQLRDRLAIVIDEVFFYPNVGTVDQLTTTGDVIDFALTMSDQVADLGALSDRRIIFTQRIARLDFGTAAGGQMYVLPVKQSFSPPLIMIPNRVFLSMNSIGLASAGAGQVRMHFRTVTITQDQQLMEILETFQMST